MTETPESNTEWTTAYDRAIQAMNYQRPITHLMSKVTDDSAQRATAYALIAICERLDDIKEVLELLADKES